MPGSIRVVCGRAPKAIVAETAPHTHHELNLIPEVELVVREQMPGYDAAPVIVDAGCGYEFEIPDEPWVWDVNTDERADGEWVIERHLSVVCPRCGVIADHLSVPVEPYLFTEQGLDKRERLILNNPEIQEMLADLSPERRQILLERVMRGVSGGATASYSHVTEGAVALTAATAKTIIGAKAGSAVGLMWSAYEIGFDGVSASAVPVLLELCYCFPTGTLVGGPVPTPIEEVTEVIGHDGRLHKVTRHLEREYNGHLSVIKATGALPIRSTPEHPFLVVRPHRWPNGKATRPHAAELRTFVPAMEHYRSQPEWVEAKDIRVGDFLVAPRWVQPDDSVPQDWLPSPYATNTHRARPVKPLDPADRDVAWMLGLYAADGSGSGGNGVQFVLSPTDDVERLIAVWARLGLPATVRERQTYRIVTVNSRTVARSFAAWFGKRQDKRLPGFVFDGWPLDAVLEGLVDGDGHWAERNRRFEYTTTSPQLAEQIRMILVSLGESPTIVRRERKPGRGYPNGKPVHVICWAPAATQHRTAWWRGLYLMPVTALECEHYEGLVHDLSVQDAETFTVNGAIVHNCTFGANSPGTNSTGTTERQQNGRVVAADWTGGRNWTTEPTTITVITEKLLSPNGGLIIYDWPLGREPDSALSEGFALRCTAPAAVNVRATQDVQHL